MLFLLVGEAGLRHLAIGVGGGEAFILEVDPTTERITTIRLLSNPEKLTRLRHLPA